ncbi:NTP transferase domain-containing protein [Kribbella antiqua]|uniref:NTP transferase domain-containing protein n=1 Tax=Kribbella antiqua TaxID=2512217 RepID=UPI00130519B0|nr:NTP transferase domain-containing protein [Kribbella antiqua]
MSKEAVRVALLLAAGRGILRRVGGVSLLERGVRELRKAGIERVVVVADDVIAVTEDLPVEVVVDPDWGSGTASSVLTGLSMIGDRRCLVVMGDVVFEADDVRRLIQTPTGNAQAVDRNVADHRATRIQLDGDGQVASLGPDLDEYDAVDAGLTVVEVQDVLMVTYRVRESWLELRQQLLTHGCRMQSTEMQGFWASADTPELEQLMWRRCGPKPTDGVVARVLNRRISGPITRLLLRTGVVPEVATVLAFVVTLVAAGLVATSNTWLMIAGGLGILLGSALGGVDGELARISGRTTRLGATLLGRYAELAVVLAFVLAAGSTRTAWIWGFAAAAGCLLISYIHAVGRDTDVRLLFRREFRLLIFAVAAVATFPLWGLVAVAVAANLDALRGVVLLLRE